MDEIASAEAYWLRVVQHAPLRADVLPHWVGRWVSTTSNISQLHPFHTTDADLRFGEGFISSIPILN